MISPTHSTASSTSPLREKWGAGLAPGFLVVPNALLMRQHELEIGDGELVVLLHLLMAWWKEGEWPFLGVATIARRMGVNPRTVQRHLHALETRGLVRRVGSSLRTQVRYDLSGTVKRVADLAETIPVRRQQRAMGEKETTAPF